jgi:hypothetical protein
MASPECDNKLLLVLAEDAFMVTASCQCGKTDSQHVADCYETYLECGNLDPKIRLSDAGIIAVQNLITTLRAGIN